MTRSDWINTGAVTATCGVEWLLLPKHLGVFLFVFALLLCVVLRDAESPS